MPEKVLVKKRVIVFTVLAAAIAWIVFMMIPVTGSEYGSGLSIIFLAAGMFAPAIASILTRLITKEGFGNMYLRPHFRGHIRHYVLLWFAPVVLLLLSMAVFFLIFPGQFDPNMTILQEAAAKTNTTGLTAKTMLLITALQIIVIGPIINIIPTMGEELGWRGYLLPKLRMLMSDRKALVITGVIWGFWHAPVIVMGHNYGTEYWGYPWLGILAMVFFCVVLGIIEGYATIKLDSAIPAGMIHSAVNAAAGFPIYLAKADYNPILGPTITGFLGGIPFVIVAVVLIVRVRKMRMLSAESAEVVARKSKTPE